MSGEGPGSGGFLNIRVDGTASDYATFTADPQSNVNYPGIASGLGHIGLTYDTVHRRWLPVPPAWVLRDFSRYAYPAKDGTVHWVDLNAGNTDNTLANSNAIGSYLLAAEPDGIYGAPGLTTLERITWKGELAIVDKTHNRNTIVVGDGVAFGSTETPPAITQIDRIDLRSGAVTPWFVWGARNLSVAGVDSQGNPMVVGWWPGAPASVWNPSHPSTSDSPLGQPVTYVSANGDPGTVTFVEGQGAIWFATTTFGVIFATRASPGSAGGLSLYNGYIAGPCVRA